MGKAKIPIALVPLAVGPGLGWVMSKDLREPFGWKWIAIGTLIGMVMALTVFLLDPKPRPISDGAAPSNSPQATLLGRFFAVVSLLFPLSFVSLLCGIVGLILNRRVKGWPWYASLVGTLLSGTMAIIVVVIIANAKPR